MKEVEIKIALDSSDLARLRARLTALGLADESQTRSVHSFYYDTPDLRLRRTGTALRLRRDGTQWVQTLKTRARLSCGLSQVHETDCPTTANHMDLKNFSGSSAERIARLIGDAPLAPVFETAMRRENLLLPLTGGGSADLFIDMGEIRSGRRAAPFQEAELELIEGQSRALYDLIAMLFPDGGLRLASMSKAGRGYLLREHGRIRRPVAPCKARRVPLAMGQTAETAARDILSDGFRQISANIEVVLTTDDIGGPHQLRVGLRRLRSALSMFTPELRSPELTRMKQEARWLASEISRLRDLDVASAELIAPELSEGADPGFAVLAAAVERHRVEERTRIRDLLRSARAQMFQIELARFIETRGWLLPEDYSQTQRLATPVQSVTLRELDRQWRSVQRQAKHIETLDIAARHAMRKNLKKLRYTIEFTSSLVSDDGMIFLRRLKRLQDLFGSLNDLAMAETLFLHPDGPGAGDPSAQRAVGRILGTGAVRAEADWLKAQGLWRELKGQRKHWRGTFRETG